MAHWKPMFTKLGWYRQEVKQLEGRLRNAKSINRKMRIGKQLDKARVKLAEAVMSQP